MRVLLANQKRRNILSEKKISYSVHIIDSRNETRLLTILRVQDSPF